jgi:hypothetical protein
LHLHDLQIKARFWRSFSHNTAMELRYMADDVVHWFNDALVGDLERIGKH